MPFDIQHNGGGGGGGDDDRHERLNDAIDSFIPSVVGHIKRWKVCGPCFIMGLACKLFVRHYMALRHEHMMRPDKYREVPLKELHDDFIRVTSEIIREEMDIEEKAKRMSLELFKKWRRK